MVNPLEEDIIAGMHSHITKVLTVASIAIPNRDQYQAFRTFVLDEFGNKGFRPELKALIQQHEMDRNGQAHTARKEVPR